MRFCVHSVVTDGLFRDTGTFYVMRQTDLKPLEDLFRAEVFKFLKKEGKDYRRIDPEIDGMAPFRF